MTNPKIDPKGCDWRAELDKVDGEKYNKVKGRTLQTIQSFRELRKHLGLTQIDVAQLLNVTQSNVSKMEAKVIPSLETLNTIVQGKGRIRVLVEMDQGDIVEFALD